MPAHVSAAHAARMYGRSEKTVRRWIAAGRLPAERIGGAYLVDLADVARLVGDVSAPTSAQVSAPSTDSMSTQSADTDVRPGEGDVRPSDRSSALAQADALASLIQGTLAPIVAPLVAELAASRQANERQAEQLVSMAETIGTLRAENDALEARLEGRWSEPVPGPLPFWRRLYTRWWLGWLILATLAVVCFALWLSR